MTDSEERAFTAGHRAAWVQMLRTALQELDYGDPERTANRWAAEREAVVAALWSLCGKVGDTDWHPTDNLADVIDKHLARHLLVPKD